MKLCRTPLSPVIGDSNAKANLLKSYHMLPAMHCKGGYNVAHELAATPLTFRERGQQGSSFADGNQKLCVLPPHE